MSAAKAASGAAAGAAAATAAGAASADAQPTSTSPPSLTVLTIIGTPMLAIAVAYVIRTAYKREGYAPSSARLPPPMRRLKQVISELEEKLAVKDRERTAVEEAWRAKAAKQKQYLNLLEKAELCKRRRRTHKPRT